MSTIKSEISNLVEQHFKPLINTGETPNASQAPGGICGVLYKGEKFYFPYGYISKSGDPPTENTVFGLGSVTKTLTTSILGQQTSPCFYASVNDHLPAGYRLQPAEQPVTFEQLATFTAGIPSVPDKTGQNTTQSEFINFINSVAPPPNKRLPTPNVYSDSSIGFLAQILMHMAGYTDFDGPPTNRWWNENLLEGLSMNNTGYPVPHDSNHPLSNAFKYNDKSSSYELIYYSGWVPWGAAGRAFSTCADMMNFVMANAGISTIDNITVSQKILDGMRYAQREWAPPQGSIPNSKQGFAWIVWNSDSIDYYVGKAGGVPGVSSYVTVMPSHKLGVVFLTNMQHVKTENAAKKLTESLLTI